MHRPPRFVGRGEPAGPPRGYRLVRPMRISPYVLVSFLWAPVLTGCLAPPTNEAWLDVGFRTPEQTFRTFQTALRADYEDLEWRCLSGELKRRHRLSQIAYRQFRQELFRSQPWLKWAAKAEIRAVHPLGPDRCRLVAEVDTFLGGSVFSVEMRREGYYELYVGDDEPWDDSVAFREMFALRDGRLDVVVPMPEDVPLEAVELLAAGREWKISDFPLQADP